MTDAARDGAGGGRGLSGFHVGAGAPSPQKGRKIMDPTELKFTVPANLRDDVPGLLVQADGVVAGIEGNPALFPNSGAIVQGLKDARQKLAEKHTASAPLKKSRQVRSPEEKALRARLTESAHFTET